MEVDGWVPAEVSFDVSIAAVHAWEIIRSDAEVNDGRLTGYWEVKNIGNSPDGLVVGVECTDFTDFGVIPPNELESSTNQGRSFEVLDVPINGILIFEVWMDVPSEVPIDSNAILTVEIRSFRDPAVQHTVEHSTQIDGMQPTQPVDPDEPSVFSNFLQRWLQTILIVTVSIVGTIAVAFAIRHLSLIHI